MDVGRNDPCPCGSGLKYKKCCARKDEIEKRATGRMRQVQDVLDADAPIYRIWLEWRKARENSDFNFLYELLAEGSSLALRFPSGGDFVVACDRGSLEIPSGHPAEFRHLSVIEGKTARLLQTIENWDPASNTVRCECLSFVLTPAGWRLSDMSSREVSGSDPAAIDLCLFDGNTATNGMPVTATPSDENPTTRGDQDSL